MSSTFGDATNMCFEYKGQENKWDEVTRMGTKRSWFDGIWTKDWKWWVAGGNDAGRIPKTSEIFNPDTKTWSIGPALPVEFWTHCITSVDRSRDTFLLISAEGQTRNGSRYGSYFVNVPTEAAPSYLYTWSNKTWKKAPKVESTGYEGGCTTCGLTKGITGDIILLSKKGTYLLKTTPVLGSRWKTIFTGRGNIHGGTLFFDAGVQQLLLIGSDDRRGDVVYFFDNNKKKWDDSKIRLKIRRYHSAIIPMRETTLDCKT